MTIALGAVGALNTGTTALTVAYPAGIAVGDMLVLGVSSKYGLPDAKSGWTLVSESGTHGSNGVDTGSVYCNLFYKVADVGDVVSTAVVLIGGNSAAGRMVSFTKTSADAWSAATTSGSDNAPGTGWSVTCGTDPGVMNYDMIVAVTAVNTNEYSLASETLVQPGCTFSINGTQDVNSGTAQGDDCALFMNHHSVTGGPSTGVPVYGMTSTGSSADAPCGASILLRLRDTAHVSSSSVVLSSVSDPGAVSLNATAASMTISADQAILYKEYGGITGLGLGMGMGLGS